MGEPPTTLGDESQPASEGPPFFLLQVVEGPDTGKGLPIDAERPGPALVGTGPLCDLKLGDSHVSRRHVALAIVGRRLRVTDLGSRNGTFVDGVAVADAFVSGGEAIRIGTTTLRVHRRVGSVLAQQPSAAPETSFGRVIGASPEMQRLYPLCRKIAAANLPAIIEGETGTGKEVLAEAIHEMGPRAAGPFVVFDCTAVHPSLMESELFGHERGAFTGAIATRKGLFEQAHGGTLLIDEIGDLDLTMQPKLLRAIERSEIRRVGGDKPIQVDVRILLATRRDLDAMVEAGLFRDDLFHRISVARIELPPLRSRRGDVRMLVEAFARQMGARPGAIPPAVVASWEADRWPGNVRSLRNAVARWVALGDVAREATSPTGTPQATTDAIEAVLRQDLPLVRARELVVAELERRYVERVLGQHGGNVARAAAASGIARRHFHRIKARSRE